MTNPTLEAAWNDYAERSGLTIDGMACSPAKAQIARFAFEAGWERRAQPEGEAPQAEAVRCKKCEGEGQIFSSTSYGMSKRCEECSGTGSIPAAQHAESGARAAMSDDDTARWAERHGASVEWANDADMHHIIKMTPPDMRAALAAQSQGAPREDGK